MAWGEFSPDGTKWLLPPERSKNHRAHTLPVLPAMRAILDSVPKMASRDQLFGERADRGFTKWDVCKRDLDQRTGITVPWLLHDIRRSVATKMADDLGVQPHILEAILNHYSGHRAGAHGVYNRASYATEVRNALATWHDHIRALVEGGERKILPFEAAAGG
jgi:integrase